MSLTEKQISTLLLALDVAFIGLDDFRSRLGIEDDPNFDALCADVRGIRSEWEARHAPKPAKPRAVAVVDDEALAVGVDFEEYAF